MAFLNQVGEGVVVEAGSDRYLVEDENGFEDWYESYELVMRKQFTVDGVQKKDERPGYQKQEAPKGKTLMEKDLHFNKLVDFPKNFNRFAKLEIQMREARKFLDKARTSGNKRVILIHGVGEGRLKEEIHTMLERMDGLRFYDASYAEYGRGATEVEFY